MLASRLLDDSREKSVTFETGRKAVVSSEHLHPRADGSYFLDLMVDPRPPDSVPVATSASDVIIPRVEEQLVIEKRTTETGRVRVTKTVVESPQTYDASIVHEDYVIERVPVNREVSAIEPARVEGDVTIISVYEEELVTTTRLMLREEIHLIKRRRVESRQGAMPIRKHEVHVERSGAPDFPKGGR